MSPSAFQIAAADNVATLVDELAAPGPVAILGGLTTVTLAAREPIFRGHKIALRALAPGDAVVKFGVRIGHATRPVAPGEWVHLHNLASDHDERSGTLELHSGAPTDTAAAYE
jgi:hypothetical protein